MSDIVHVLSLSEHRELSSIKKTRRVGNANKSFPFFEARLFLKVEKNTKSETVVLEAPK